MEWYSDERGIWRAESALGSLFEIHEMADERGTYFCLVVDDSDESLWATLEDAQGAVELLTNQMGRPQ